MRVECALHARARRIAPQPRRRRALRVGLALHAPLERLAAELGRGALDRIEALAGVGGGVTVVLAVADPVIALGIVTRR